MLHQGVAATRMSPPRLSWFALSGFVSKGTLMNSRRWCNFVVVLLFSSALFAAEQDSKSTDGALGAIALVRDGASKHVIVLEPSASPSEKTAAKELQLHLKACTGVELPIRTGMPEDNSPMIVLGCGPVAAKLGIEPTPEQLGDQGCVVRTVAPHLVIAGTPQAGTLQGARRFLEQQLGVRWYAPGVTRTPRQKDVSIAALARLVRPAFVYRDTSYTWPGGDAMFHARRGMNVGSGDADYPQGRQYSADGRCHSYFRWINPDEFFDKHPEYFSEIGGKRVREETQLCLTNPEVLEIVTERMLQRMREAPQFQQHNFSQMDWYNCCECEKCRVINEKYGTSGGTQFWFVNELAKRTSKVFPDKLIGTLAYMYTEEPPQGMTMHPNVAVWLCHMYPSCDSHPVASCPHNADYKRRAEAWSKICSHLYIWHYIVDFAHYYNPFPNFRALESDMRFYQSIGVEGIFAQAMGNQGGGGEFSLLRGYLISELLKDPQQDGQAVIRDFLEGYYGAAAGPIGQYVALLHDMVEKDNIHMHLYTNPAQGYLPDEVMSESERLFDAAEAAVRDDAELLERVRVARMPLVYATLFPRNGYRIEDGVLHFNGPLTTTKEVQEFGERMKRHGFEAIREMGGDPAQLPMLNLLFHAPMPLVVLENEQLQVEVAPLLGGRALRIIDRKTGRCATAFNTKQNLIYPFCGGEESRVGEFSAIFEGGSMSQFLPLVQTPRSVTLVAKTGNGFKMTRTLTLAEHEPVLTVNVKITNPSDQPRSAQLRSYMSLDLGKARATRVRFTSRSGQAIDQDASGILDRFREGQRFYKADTPAEAWTFSGEGGWEVTQRFARNQVDSTWIYCYPEENNELEVELWAPKAMLAPGKSISLEHSLEVKAAAK
jgi:hypothetical protein